MSTHTLARAARFDVAEAVSDAVTPVAIRPAGDGDGYALTALISACWAEYDGCILDVEREEPQLKRIASHYAERNGRVWVAVRDGLVVGSVACEPSDEPNGLRLKILYVLRHERRRGLAAQLCDLVEAEARDRTATFVDLWSDTRFEDAHRLYEQRGYLRGPETRALDDISRSVEYYYRLELG